MEQSKIIDTFDPYHGGEACATVPFDPSLFLLNFHATLRFLVHTTTHGTFQPSFVSIVHLLFLLRGIAMPITSTSRALSRSLSIPIKKIDVVYTNDSTEVEKVLQRYQGSWIRLYEMFVGMDFEYTNERNTEKVDVVQLGLRDEVLVFHCSRYH